MGLKGLNMYSSTKKKRGLNMYINICDAHNRSRTYEVNQPREKNKKKIPIRNFKDYNELFYKFKCNFWKIIFFNKDTFSKQTQNILQQIKYNFFRKRPSFVIECFENTLSFFQVWRLVLLFMNFFFFLKKVKTGQ
jgi:hypothetical protein